MTKLLTPVRLALLGGFLFSGCGYPKYVNYTSPQGDFVCLVPWAWNVMTESEGADYSNATFVGPFEPKFYLGVPSFSVRWHAHYRPHRLPDGLLEMYSGPDDYVRHTLETLYGPNRLMAQEVQEIEAAGRKAKHFVVVSPVKVAAERRWGVREDVSSKQRVNVRQHAYVVVPAKRGFYVLVYPATRDGYPLYEKQFNQLVHSFEILKDGPSGPGLR